MSALDHVALVVPELEPVVERLGLAPELIGPIEEFPSEGTREVYVGNGTASLLLLQPLTSDGPYARALGKRGPGLHHVALRTPDLEEFLRGVRGWLLHPASVDTIARSRTAWLARPGVPTLVEVQEASAAEGEPLVTAVEVPGPLDALTPSAGLDASPDGTIRLTVAGRRRSVSDLVGSR